MHRSELGAWDKQTDGRTTALLCSPLAHGGDRNSNWRQTRGRWTAVHILYSAKIVFCGHFSNKPLMLYNKLKRHLSPEKWPNRKLACKTVTITVVVQVNTAGEQHVDVEFHSFLYSFRRSHACKLLKNCRWLTSKMRYITLTQVPPPLLLHNITKSLPPPLPPVCYIICERPLNSLFQTG